MAINSTASHHLVGWVSESPDRGTLSIISSCLITTFLCTWVVIHPRVCTDRWLHGLHKVLLFFKCIIAPEFIAVEGLQEWTQARRVRNDSEELTKGRLKLVHAFYIGMLGLRYRTSDKEKIIWPNQYIWLLHQGFVNWNDHERGVLAEDVIYDKSNADSGVKLLALVQVLWFVAQAIMRRAHHLPLCQFESMTLSYIPLFAITYFFWWLKPKDIMTPSVIDITDISNDQMETLESLAVSSAFDIGLDRKLDRKTAIWALTPRVFEKEAEDRDLHREWFETQQMSAPRCETINPRGEPHKASLHPEDLHLLKITARPTETVLAFWDPDVYHSKILWPVICLFGASFGGLHLVSWNAVFPTKAEQWIWRIAGLVSVFSMLIFMQFERVVLRWKGPMTVVAIASPALYLLSRLVMIGGVIAAFRASDPAVYQSYRASSYWIHVF